MRPEFNSYRARYMSLISCGQNRESALETVARERLSELTAQVNVAQTSFSQQLEAFTQSTARLESQLTVAQDRNKQLEAGLRHLHEAAARTATERQATEKQLQDRVTVLQQAADARQAALEAQAGATAVRLACVKVTSVTT